MLTSEVIYWRLRSTRLPRITAEFRRASARRQRAPASLARQASAVSNRVMSLADKRTEQQPTIGNMSGTIVAFATMQQLPLLRHSEKKTNTESEG
jgi:hypothetical protein